MREVFDALSFGLMECASTGAAGNIQPTYTKVLHGGFIYAEHTGPLGTSALAWLSPWWAACLWTQGETGVCLWAQDKTGIRMWA